MSQESEEEVTVSIIAKTHHVGQPTQLPKSVPAMKEKPSAVLVHLTSPPNKSMEVSVTSAVPKSFFRPREASGQLPESLGVFLSLISTGTD